MSSSVRRGSGTWILNAVLRLLAAAGLAIDAAVHARLAPRYDGVVATFSQGGLFRTEAAVASLAVVLVLLWRRPAGDIFAWLVALTGLAAIFVYRYADLGVVGPVPDMYEPIWYSDKVWAAVAEGVAVVALSWLLVRWVAARGRPTSNPRVE